MVYIKKSASHSSPVTTAPTRFGPSPTQRTLNSSSWRSQLSAFPSVKRRLCEMNEKKRLFTARSFMMSTSGCPGWPYRSILAQQHSSSSSLSAFRSCCFSLACLHTATPSLQSPQRVWLQNLVAFQAQQNVRSEQLTQQPCSQSMHTRVWYMMTLLSHILHVRALFKVSRLHIEQ